IASPAASTSSPTPSMVLQPAMPARRAAALRMPNFRNVSSNVILLTPSLKVLRFPRVILSGGRDRKRDCNFHATGFRARRYMRCAACVEESLLGQGFALNSGLLQAAISVRAAAVDLAR